jgi:hypothetical protein
MPLSATRSQSTDASDAFNTFWKAMEQLDHVSQPLAFATASLGLAESPQREMGRNGSYSSDTDMEGSGRPRRTLLGSRLKAQSPDGSSPTTLDDAHGSDVVHSSQLRQSVIDLRNDFDEIAEEGAWLPSQVVSRDDMVIRLRLVRLILLCPIQIRAFSIGTEGGEQHASLRTRRDAKTTRKYRTNAEIETRAGPAASRKYCSCPAGGTLTYLSSRLSPVR